MKVPNAAWSLVKEVTRHLLRRPVVNVVCIARVPDGGCVLVRRGDTGHWSLPGGTLEWGETLREGIVRELREEAGVEVLELGALGGVYSAPWRDPRAHLVSVVVHARVTLPRAAPSNPLEITEVGVFSLAALPEPLAPGMRAPLRDARQPLPVWE